MTIKQLIAFITGAQCYGCKDYLNIKDKSTIICHTCANKIIPTLPITFLIKNTPYTVYSLGKYEGPLKKLLTAKYSGDISPYKYIALKMIEKINEKKIIFDIILYIPQHPIKQAQRWLNHTYEIAKTISHYYQKPLFENITCNEKTKQSTLSYKDRIKLSKDVFTIQNHLELNNKNILIIDDVFTTGSTIKSLIYAIEESKPKDISVFVAAKT